MDHMAQTLFRYFKPFFKKKFSFNTLFHVNSKKTCSFIQSLVDATVDECVNSLQWMQYVNFLSGGFTSSKASLLLV